MITLPRLARVLCLVSYSTKARKPDCLCAVPAMGNGECGDKRSPTLYKAFGSFLIQRLLSFVHVCARYTITLATKGQAQSLHAGACDHRRVPGMDLTPDADNTGDNWLRISRLTYHWLADCTRPWVEGRAPGNPAMRLHCWMRTSRRELGLGVCLVPRKHTRWDNVCVCRLLDGAGLREGAAAPIALVCLRCVC